MVHVRASTFALLMSLPAVSSPALAELPSRAQFAAVMQACRSDFIRYCADVPPGGGAVLRCFAEHAGEVSPSCRKALATAMPPPPSLPFPPDRPSAMPITTP